MPTPYTLLRCRTLVHLHVHMQDEERPMHPVIIGSNISRISKVVVAVVIVVVIINK